VEGGAKTEGVANMESGTKTEREKRREEVRRRVAETGTKIREAA
jgi:hypothetical protein